MKTRHTTIALLFLCNIVSYGQEIPVPEGYSIIRSVKGDLDKDHVDELVVAYDRKADPEVEFSDSRELIVYKLMDTQWNVWKKSELVLLGEQGGGLMGDPFSILRIEHGILLIGHSGGSRARWSFLDKYRYQNEEFFLIGFTSNNGWLYECYRVVDFNLSTGKIDISYTHRECGDLEPSAHINDNEVFYKKNLKITLQNRHNNVVTIESPQYKHKFSLN